MTNILESGCTGFGWDGINFFIVAPMVLYFVFVTKAALVAERCVRCVRSRAVLAQHQGLFCSSPCAASQQAGDAQGAGAAGGGGGGHSHES